MPHQEGRQGCYRSASGTKALSYSGPSGVATGAAYSYMSDLRCLACGQEHSVER